VNTGMVIAAKTTLWVNGNDALSLGQDFTVAGGRSGSINGAGIEIYSAHKYSSNSRRMFEKSYFR
jgi:hypothetical protein